MKKYLQLLAVITTMLIITNMTLAQTDYVLNFQNLDFMKHGDFVYCGSPSYAYTNQLTVAIWVKWTTDASSFAVTPNNHENEGSYSTYIAYGSHNANDINSDNGQFWLRNAKTGNKFEFLVQLSTGAIKTVTANVGPSAVNTWYFLTGVYNGSTDPSTLKIYVGDQEAGSISFTGTSQIKSNDGTHRLNMGKLPWGYGFFVGQIDEVRIWKTALTPAEISTQRTQTASVNSTNLQSYWNFNAGTGTVIDDQGPINADGIFYSAAIDVHTEGSDFPNKIVGDKDKDWSSNNWTGMNLKTVSGAGIDETNTIVSNTINTITVTYGFGGVAPNNKTTPIVDSKVWGNDTWFGVQITGETSQWVISDKPYATPVELNYFDAKQLKGKVVLTWQTATEVENYGFEIERASTSLNTLSSTFEGQVTSAKMWENLGFIKGNSNSNSQKTYTFTDKTPPAGKVQYRLKQIDNDGSYKYSEYVEVNVGIPSTTELHQNYPNPFNPTTSIKFSLSKDTRVKIIVYDILGNVVNELVNENKQAGNHIIYWNSNETKGNKVSSGVYFYKLEAGDMIQMKKMSLMK